MQFIEIPGSVENLAELWFTGINIEFMIFGDVRFRRHQDGSIESETKLIDNMRVALQEHGDSCLIVDMAKEDGGHLLRETICHKGWNYRIESISDSLFCHLGTASFELPGHIQAISGALWNCPPSIIFQNMSKMDFNISVITTPKRIEKIDSSAFFKCDSLCEIAFAMDGELREIDGFNSCGNILKIEIPGSVEIIRCFSKCKSLREVIFRTGRLRELGGLNDCPSLSRIEIPRSVEKINGLNSLLWNSTRDKLDNLSSGLEEVVFSDDCELKEIQGFNGCELLEQISIPCSVERLCGFNSILVKDTTHKVWNDWMNAGGTDLPLVRHSGVKDVTFRGVSRLKDIEGFAGCPGLLRIEIPASVELISGFNQVTWQFGTAATSRLAEIHFSQDAHLREINGFHGNDKMEMIVAPRSLEMMDVFGSSTIPSSDVTSILKAVIFPRDSHLRKIEGLRDCSLLAGFGVITSIDEINWDHGSLHIPLATLSEEKLLDQYVESHRDLIGFSQFGFFPFLERIEIPAFVRVINRLDFYLCTSLKKINFAEESELEEIHGFNECHSIEEFEIPESVKEITGFNCCVRLKTVVFRNGGSTRDVRGFKGCESLTVAENPPICWRTGKRPLFILHTVDTMIRRRKQRAVQICGQRQKP
jgi:hypothetical protein